MKKDWPSREAQRLNYFVERGKGHYKGEACALSGFSVRQSSRLEKKASTQKSLRDLPKSGRPKVYTDEVFERCLDMFKAEEPEDKWTTEKFFMILKASKVLHRRAHKHTFLKKWKTWLRKRNQHIDYYSTKEVFKLLPSDLPKRLTYAQTMMKMLNDDPNMELVFLDETSMEHGRHPKTGGFRFPI